MQRNESLSVSAVLTRGALCGVVGALVPRPYGRRTSVSRISHTDIRTDLGFRPASVLRTSVRTSVRTAGCGVRRMLGEVSDGQELAQVTRQGSSMCATTGRIGIDVSGKLPPFCVCLSVS